jgi:hypothetical protein
MKAPPEKTQGFAVLFGIILANLVVFGQHLTVCGTETFNDAVERLINAKASMDEV